MSDPAREAQGSASPATPENASAPPPPADPAPVAPAPAPAPLAAPQASPPAHEPPRSLAGADWQCSKCGNKNVSFATLCTTCGTSAEIGKSWQGQAPSARGNARPQPSATNLLVFLFLLAVLLGIGLLYSMGALDAHLPPAWRFSELISGH